jgi:hypothetical protein
MPFTTPEQFVLLGIVLIAGWLIGYACAPSPRPYKRQLRDEAERFAQYRDDAENRLRAETLRADEHNRETEALRHDLAEAERSIATLRSARPTPLPPHDGIRPPEG